MTSRLAKRVLSVVAALSWGSPGDASAGGARGHAARSGLGRLVAGVIALGAVIAAGHARAERLEFSDAPAVSTAAAWSYFSGLDRTSPVCASPCVPDPLVVRTAHALGDDPDRIYAFVHDEIEIVPLFGVQKGARGALIDKSGTAFDQAHLLGALFRAAGIDAEYVLGAITLSQEQMSDWLGVSDPAALAETLADGGIPFDASGGNYTIMHLWVRATIGGQQYVFDAAYKGHDERAGALTAAGLDSAMGFSASNFINSQALAGATSLSTNAPEVRNFNRTNVRNALQTYSQNLLTHVRSSYADDETADVVGGRDITLYAGHDSVAPFRDDEIEPLRQPNLPYPYSEFDVFENDIPYVFRTQTTVTLSSSGAQDVFYWRLDEYYGEELVLIPMEIFPQQGNLNDPITFRFYRNGVDQLNADRIGVGGGLSFAFNHPYAANNGTYLDRALSAGGDFRAGAVQAVVGGGRMTADFGAYLEAHSSGEEGWVSIQPTGMPEPPDPIVTGGQRATKRRVAASFATQFGSAIDLTERIGASTIVVHDLVIGARTVPTVIGSGAAPLATIGAIEVHGAVSANAHSGSAAETLAVRRATAALAATLEGSAVEQNLDSVNPISTPVRLDWSSSSENPEHKRRFYWANESNWEDYVLDELLADGYYGESQINAAQGFIDAGYTLIVPRSSYLGPGPDEIIVCNPGPQIPALQCAFPGPERGGAFIAISPSGLIQWAGSVGGGGGGTNDAETNPARIFSIPEDFLERQFTSRAEAYNVDMATGNVSYTPPPDIVVGEGAYPYSLSFQRSYRSGAPYQRNHHPPPPPIFIGAQERFADTGWTSNWTHEARIQNDGQAAFGDRSPLEATDTIVAIRVLLALSADQGSDLATLQYQLGAIHAMAWWSGQLSYNAVQIVHGADNRSFFKLADGSYLGQPGDPTQIDVTGERYVPDDIGTYTAPRYYYNRMCVLATNRDGSTSFYGTWNGSFAGCDMTANPTPFRGVRWMRFQRQEFREGVVVSFDGTTLSNNLGRSISLLGSIPNFTVRDDEVQTRTVAINLALTGPGVMSVTGTDANTWVYDGSNPANWRVFAPSSTSSPIAAFNFTEARGQVATLTDAVGNTARYWISSGRVGAMIDPLHPSTNAVASRTYFDEHGQPVRVVNRLGYETRTTYDNFRRAHEVMRPEGNRERYAYNATHDRIETRRIAKGEAGGGPNDIVTSTAYDALCGMPTSETDARENTTTYALVPNRCLISTVTQPAVDNGTDEQPTLVNPQTTYTWNSLGQLLARTDPTGRVTTNAYNAGTHYLESVTAPGGAITQFGRNPQGDITSVTDPRGYVHTGAYDLARRLTRYDGPSGTNAATRWTYDPDGMVTLIEQATGDAIDPWAETLYSYWETGRVKTMTDADGGVTQYFYDALNRLDHALDPVSRRSETNYDAEGQVLEELRGVGTADQITYATRAWTPNGLLDWVQDANANRSNLDYDGFDRLSRLYMPLPALGQQAHNGADYEEYGYDPNGNRTSLRLRSGETIAYCYDALNRESRKDIPIGTSEDVYSSYDLAGRRIFARFEATPPANCNLYPNDGQGIDYTYDTPGRLLTETSYGRALTFGYDPSSNRTAVTYHTPAGASALTVNYTYDALNRVDRIGENGVFSGAQLLADYAYDAQSRRTSLARAGGGGRTTAYEYSLASRLTRLNHGALDGANNADWAYSYTPAGQVATRTLIEAYEWSVPALDEDYTRNGLNQYTSVEGVSFTHDPRGNLTDDGDRRFCYGLENRLKGVANAGGDCVSAPSVMSLAYDPLGRLRQTIGTATTQFLYDGDRLVAEYDGSGALQRRYAHGPGVDEPLVWYEGSGTSDRRWLVSDRQGSVIAATDSSGALIGSVYRYGPYGEPDATNGWTGSRFRYTGQIALPEAQLYYYKARVYDPGLGRLLQTDPVGYEDDLNLYAYVRNDPLNMSDPTGREGAGVWTNRNPFRMTPEEAAQFEAQATAIGSVVGNALPGLGEAIGGAEFLQNPTLGGAIGLAAGLLPGGDAARPAIREGVDGLASTLRTGPHAAESIPAHPGRPTAGEQREINRIGGETGCHTCGSPDAGTQSGNFIGDHQPPTALNEGGQPQQFLPHCDTCSRRQAGEVTGEVMRRRRDAARRED